MAQSVPGGEADAAANDARDKRYRELLDSFLNDEKNEALGKHPELRAAYKAQEIYEIYFLKGATDEVGLVELKKKVAQKIIGELVYGKDSSKS